MRHNYLTEEFLMVEDLTKMWGSFSLIEEDDVDVEIQKTTMAWLRDRGRSCLVGKLLADKFVGKESIKSSMLQWWKLKGTVSFKVVGENLFLIDFEHY